MVSRHESATPFNRLAWLRGAEQGAGSRKVEILVVWIGDRMVGCMPVIWERWGLPLESGLRIARHLGAPLSDRLGLMVEGNDPMLIAEIFRAIQRRRPVACIELNELYDDGSALASSSGFARRYCIATHVHPTCRVPVLELSTERPQEKDLPQRVRAELRRERRRASEAGAIVQRIAPTGDATAWLEQIIAVERASWKGTDGVGIFSGKRRERWMREALTGLGRSRQIKVVALVLGARIVSYRLGLFEAGRLYDYNCAYIPEYSKIACGRLLLDEFVQWGYDEGWKAIDASRVSRISGHVLHERMNTSVQQYRVRYFSRRPGGLVASTGQALWARFKPVLRRWREALRGAREKLRRPATNPEIRT